MGAIAVPKPVRPLRVLPLPTLSDERLAELAGAGHSDALGALYERYREALSRYCRSIVRDPEDAGDALQNTMLAVLRALEGRSLAGPVRPWLYRIAHNESISILRRRHPHEELSLETPDRADTEGASFTHARLDALLADLRSLPERQRGALVMRELGGLDYAEIADALDLSPVAARKHVFEARVALHDIAAGREADCGEIVRRISDGDGRVLRARSVRGHLRGCPACAAFERGLRQRRDTLVLIPVLPLASTGALLVAILHGGAASTSGLATGGSFAGGSVAGGSVAVGSMAAAGSLLGGGSVAAIKGFAVAGAIAVAGAGVIVGTGISSHARHAHRAALVTASPARGPRARSATPAALPAAKPVRLAVTRTRVTPPRPAPVARLTPAPSNPRRVSAVGRAPYSQSPSGSEPIKQAPVAAVPVATKTPTAPPTTTPAPTPAAPPAATAPPVATAPPATPATATTSWIDAIIASALQRAGADWAAAAAQAQQQLAAGGLAPAAIQAIIASIFSGGHG